MPSLATDKFERVQLESTKNAPTEEEKAWVDINSTVNARSLVGVDGITNSVERNAVVIANNIKDWNLTVAGDPTKKADITADNVLSLAVEDFTQLLNIVNGLKDAQSTGATPDLKEI